MCRPLLEIRSLRKCYAGRSPVFCAGLETLTVYPGQAVGITGPSGCGKSTLLEMLALLGKPDTAERFFLYLEQQAYDLMELWRRSPQRLASIRRTGMGFVHQAGGLYPFLTVRENVSLPLRLNHVDPDRITARVDELLDFLRLRDVAQGLPEALSYGERQRAAVARALIHRPRLILADEPTSALDPETALTTMELMKQGAERFGSALLVVSHDHALLARAGIPAFAMEAAAGGGETCYTLSVPDTSAHPAPPSEDNPVEAPKDRSSPVALPPRPRRGFSHLHFLAWRDFCHERALSLCAVLAFAAALTPFMVLGGLRSGVIDTLSQRLLNNPAALAVNPYSSQRYTEEDIAELKALPSVAFVVPLTRTLASTVHVEREDRPPVAADAVPTAPNDPLLTRYAVIPSENGVVITRHLARSLPDVEVGEQLTLMIGRRSRGRPEEVRCEVFVEAILPDAADWKSHIYMPLELLLDMERYRDGLAVPERNWPGEEGERTLSYAGFRMYVDSLEAVIPIRDELKRRGINAYTFAREVETIQSLKGALTLTTLLVGGVTLGGMAFSLASLAVANVRRKARLFAQSRLMGLTLPELTTLPLLQMTFIAAAAAFCSLLLYYGTATLIDVAASPWLEPGESACRLPVRHILVFYGGTLVLACLCGLGACRHLLKLQPAEVMRRDA